MANNVIMAGDSYAIRRPLFTYSLVGPDNQPFDLTGCVVRTTFKPTILAQDDDPTDATAPIKHTLRVNGAGVVTESAGLALATTAAAGTIQERITAAETRALPLNVPLFSDVELTDANGEVFTWLFEDTLTVKSGVTNRNT